MGAAFSSGGLTVPAYLDLNIGMNRTGIVPGAEAFQLYRAAAATDGVTPVGLHAYDGHIRDSDFDQRKQKCDEAFASVTALKQALKQAGFVNPVVIAAAAPAFPFIAGGRKWNAVPVLLSIGIRATAKVAPNRGFCPQPWW